MSNANAATESKAYPLTGIIVSVVTRGMTNGADPKPFARFRFAYPVTAKDGRVRVQEDTGMAFGQGLANIEPALAADGQVTMVGRFRTSPEGARSIGFYALPREKGGQASA